MTYEAGSLSILDSPLHTGNGIQARENHKSVNGMQLNSIRVWQMYNVNALHRRCRRLYTVVSVTHSSSRGLTLDYVNDIQARKSHKSVNCMQLNSIRVWLIHNVNALHRRIYTRLQGLHTAV